jgi:hypothetical protein
LKTSRAADYERLRVRTAKERARLLALAKRALA